MIDSIEIKQKSEKFQIDPTYVQRDYIFSWILAGMYQHSKLKDHLVLKGGNCFRKAYFENTRYSNDLDFSCKTEISPELLQDEFNSISDYISAETDIEFDKDRTKVKRKKRIDPKILAYDVKLVFNNFYGKRSTMPISVDFDVTEFDRIYLPVQDQDLIHPYSDADKCEAKIRCVKLEELLASKLKCLLQRIHIVDLFDYVYSTFIKNRFNVRRSEILSVFFKKTIYESVPGIVRGLLLNIPFEKLREDWNNHVKAPKQSEIEYDQAVDLFKQDISESLPKSPSNNVPGKISELSFFPSHQRNPIMEAGRTKTLLKLTYHGIQRKVEPYSLKYKIRKRDGMGQEYFYCYDQTGGLNSGEGIKALLSDKIEAIENTTEKFEPQYHIEVSKAGELGDKPYFGKTPPT